MCSAGGKRTRKGEAVKRQGRAEWERRGRGGGRGTGAGGRRERVGEGQGRAEKPARGEAARTWWGLPWHLRPPRELLPGRDKVWQAPKVLPCTGLVPEAGCPGCRQAWGPRAPPCPEITSLAGPLLCALRTSTPALVSAPRTRGLDAAQGRGAPSEELAPQPHSEIATSRVTFPRRRAHSAHTAEGTWCPPGSGPPGPAWTWLRAPRPLP